MSRIISISNQKGGVGKTTTTGALASGLKKKGYSVLALDLDPQCNLSFSMGADNENNATIYDVLKGDLKTCYAIQHAPVTDMIPATILLSSVELEFTNTGREYLLKEALAPVADLYDYVLIDTPPALSVLTVNAFTASDYIIVPMLSDIFSLQGIAQLYDTVDRVKKYCNPRLQIAGILLTKYNPRTLLSSEIRGTAEMIAADLGICLFDTFIRSSVAISEAQSVQSSILEYAPRNHAVEDYSHWVEELFQKGIC